MNTRSDPFAKLNERQRAYLLAVYAEDQAREVLYRGRGSSKPAGAWRWIEYGPVGARHFDSKGSSILRLRLEQAGLVDQGTGSSWASLVRLDLINTRYEDTGFIDARSGQPIKSLMVRLTRAGRATARLLSGKPARKPMVIKPLPLTALRLIAFGQENPDLEFEWCSPWTGGAFVPNYLITVAIAKGLIKRGLLAGEAPHELRITPAGRDLDVTKEPNWKPAPAPRY